MDFYETQWKVEGFFSSDFPGNKFWILIKQILHIYRTSIYEFVQFAADPHTHLDSRLKCDVTRGLLGLLSGGKSSILMCKLTGRHYMTCCSCCEKVFVLLLNSVH